MPRQVIITCHQADNVEGYILSRYSIHTTLHCAGDRKLFEEVEIKTTPITVGTHADGGETDS